MKYLKIYGERNTGTNYLTQLVQINYNVQILRSIFPKLLDKVILYNEFIKNIYFAQTESQNLGWKHASVENIFNGSRLNPDEVGIVTISKNPYSWILSMQKRPYHLIPKPIPLSDFIRFKIKPQGRDRVGSEKLNVIEFWNKKTRSYLELQKTAPSIINITYESLVDNPFELVESIGSVFNLDQKTEKIENYDDSTKKDKGKDYSFYKSYYLDEKWRSEFTEEDINYINQYLDKELTKELGYTVL